jgi:integrase
MQATSGKSTQPAPRCNAPASTQNQAFTATLFFYKDVLGTPLKSVEALRATRPERIRRAPTVAETRALIAAVRPVAGYPTNLVARLLYGCGLRVSEPLNLRVKDVCFDGGKLFIGVRLKRPRQFRQQFAGRDDLYSKRLFQCQQIIIA